MPIRGDQQQPFYSVHDLRDGSTGKSILGSVFFDMESGEINLQEALSLYRKHFPEEGALRLLQDLQMMRHSYLNLLEEVKRIEPKNFRPGNGQKEVAAEIRRKYVQLGLIPDETLPKTLPWELIRNCKDRLGKIWRATSTLWNNYQHELIAAFRLQPGTTLTFQIGVALDGPGATVGWERAIA